MNLRSHAPLALLALPLLFGCDKASDLAEAATAEVDTSYCEALCDWAVPCAAAEMWLVLAGCGSRSEQDGAESATDQQQVEPGDSGEPGGGERLTSYCEALCDWAVPCAAAEREVDEASLRQQCLDATHAIDSTCADAEAGDVNEADAAAINTCVDAIEEEAAAGECGPWTGSYDEVATATTPADCAGMGADAQEVFDAAQDGSAESNEELCTRMTHEYCVTLEECVLGEIYDGEIPEDLIKALGGTPVELCESRLSGITDGCIADDLYAPEESRTDINTTRQAARECLDALGELSCSQLISGDVPQVCSAAFTSAEDGVEFFGVLYELFTEFLDAS